MVQLEKTYTQSFLSYMFKNKFSVTTDDYKILPKNTLPPIAQPYQFKQSTNPRTFSTIKYLHKGAPRSAEFQPFMEDSGTTAIILIKDDEVIFEQYFNGYKQQTPHKLFSISKSFTSALIGIAIEKRLINSLNDPISMYIPEIKVPSVTIKQLLQMEAGISFKEGHFPWKDEAKAFLHPNARKLALGISEDSAKDFFHYNDYHLLLLGHILEKTTRMSNTEFFIQNIWNPLGMQYPGHLIVDSDEHRFEKLESGLVMTAIDLAKFGRLFLQKGNWEGTQLVPESWVQESTSRENVPSDSNHFRYYHQHPWGKMWFNRNKAYYKYLWWGYLNKETNNDYFALGALGQVLYVSPEKNAIAIRLGKKWGIKDWWPSILHNMIHDL